MGLADQAAAQVAAPDAEGAEPKPDAEGGGDTFTKPDISKAIPPELQDTVQRIVAAGMKIMYSPDMRDDIKKAVQSPDPTPKVMTDNVVGLLLTLDQKAGQSGLPGPALMPAAVELLGEAGTVLVQAGRPVSQDDFKAAIQLTFVLMSKKMGMKDGDIMNTAKSALPPGEQGAADEQAPPADASAPPAGAPPDVPPSMMQQAAAVPPQEQAP